MYYKKNWRACETWYINIKDCLRLKATWVFSRVRIMVQQLRRVGM